MNKLERVIVTNNPASAKKYEKTDKVMFLKDATPNEVYAEAKHLVEAGGRLIRPKFKEVTDYYTTVGIFFDGHSEPTPWNVRAIEAACRATQGMSEFRKKGHTGQVLEAWKNGPERRRPVK